eukprot:4299421-Amphidinium_carterae.1
MFLSVTGAEAITDAPFWHCCCCCCCGGCCCGVLPLPGLSLPIRSSAELDCVGAEFFGGKPRGTQKLRERPLDCSPREL